MKSKPVTRKQKEEELAQELLRQKEEFARAEESLRGIGFFQFSKIDAGFVCRENYRLHEKDVPLEELPEYVRKDLNNIPIGTTRSYGGMFDVRVTRMGYFKTFTGTAKGSTDRLRSAISDYGYWWYPWHSCHSGNIPTLDEVLQQVEFAFSSPRLSKPIALFRSYYHDPENGVVLVYKRNIGNPPKEGREIPSWAMFPDVRPELFLRKWWINHVIEQKSLILF